ncbi:MAG: hypothetical protein ACK5OX_18710 [Desertimonas sp.]
MADELPPPDPTTRADDVRELPAGSGSTELVPVVEHPAADAEPSTSVPPAGRPRHAGQPPWTVPVAVAGGLVLAFIVGFSLIQGVGGEDGPTRSDGWNAFVVVDARRGDVTILDRDGEELESTATGLGESTARQLGPDRIAIVADEQVALVDLGGGDTETIPIPEDLDLFVTTRGAPIPFFAAPGGGAVVVPTDDDEVIDVIAEAGWDDGQAFPEQVLATPDGEHLVVSEMTGRASAIVSVDDDEVVTVDGLALGADDAGVTVAHREADVTTLERFDLDGESRGSVELATPPRVAFGAGDEVTVVTTEGGILRVDLTGGSVEEIGQLDIDQVVDHALVPAGATSHAVVGDTTGDDRLMLYVVGVDGSASDGVEIDASIGQMLAGPDEGCVAVRSGATIDVIRLGDGELARHAELDERSPLIASFDGCVVAPIGTSSGVIVTTDDIIEVGDGAIVTSISPDGEWAVIRQRPDDGDPRTLAVPIAAFDDGEIDQEAIVELPEQTYVFFATQG